MGAPLSSAAATVEEASPLSRVKAILVASLGNLIEWYDVYAYSAFALYFAGSFSPEKRLENQQLFVALVFALGFVARPLGGLVFGFLADRFGRRNALMLSILMMCFGSLMIAAAPTVQTIGVASPIILTIARIVQGMSQGGEYGTSVAYFAEVSQADRRGFYSGVSYTAIIGGQLCAILVLLVLQKIFLTTDQLKEWGWRIPFVIGALLSVFTLYMRRDMMETELFEAAKRTTREMGSLSKLASEWKAMLLVVGVTVGGTSAFYTYTTYMQKFLKLSVKLTDDQTTAVTAGSLLFAIIIQPLYGALSDRIGRKPLLISFGVLGALGTYPLLATLKETKEPIMAFLIICLAWAIVTGYTSISAIVKAELFPTAVRAMGVAVAQAVTAVVFGGTIDYVALSFKNNGHEEWFYFYAAALIFISLIFYVALPDTQKASRIEQPS